MQAMVHPDGRLVLRGEVFRAALGRSGVRVDKQEGDGVTPAGILPIRRVLYRADRLRAPNCEHLMEPIAPDDGWCDDPADAAYNRQIRLPHDGSYEELWRRDGLYDVIGVLGWNDSPVQRGRGSAIFLHVARPDYAPTEGCIAVALPDLRQMLEIGVSELCVLSG